MAVVLWKLDCRNSWQLGTCNIFLLLFCSWIWYLELKSVFCSFLWFMDDRVREFFNFFFNFFLSLSDIFWWCLFLTVSSELWLYNMLCANAMERNAFQMNWPNDYRQRMVTVKFCIKWKLCSKIKKQNHSFVDNFSSNNNNGQVSTVVVYVEPGILTICGIWQSYASLSWLSSYTIFVLYTITQLQNFYGMDMDTWTEMILKQPTDQPSIPAHVVKICRKNLSVK